MRVQQNGKLYVRGNFHEVGSYFEVKLIIQFYNAQHSEEVPSLIRLSLVQ